MNVLLLSPGKLTFYSSTVYPHFYPRLGLRTLAACTPAGIDVTILEGEQANSVDCDQPVDLVGISVLTPHAHRAYQLADNFRRRGKSVVLGGPHPSLNPAEAQAHADAVVIGEGERVWPVLLDDYRHVALQPVYKADRLLDRADIPDPLRLDSDPERYSHFPTESGRGCAIGCDFCLVGPLFGSSFVPRPVDRVIAEVEVAKQLYGPDVTITFSENLLGSPPAAQALARSLEPLQVRWCAEGDLYHLNDDAYLDILQQAGCTWIYVETKLPNRAKNPRIFDLYQVATQRIQAKGFHLSVNFTIGYDDHDESLAQDMRDLIIDGGLVPYSFVQLLTPWPGTRCYNRLDRAGRILTRDWDLYDNLHLVYRPRQMSSQALWQMYLDFCRELGTLKQAHFKALARSTPGELPV
ncbi:MAG: B12-binding domain-containing radical SAM protein [Anaerolineae bacterium]|nr:B12-binding domain-containing radical SAM protein [Anaerolineae bacterium]